MDQLKDWNARRAGGRITIVHATGKVVGVDVIKPVGGRTVAVDLNEREFDLANPALDELLAAAAEFAAPNDTPASQRLKEALEAFA
ncbi:hypothetical protein BAJUN_01020 [Bajunvirus bajun]|uniref:Uncharacterized protein n=1 Tax=Brevundimonas phage vB_BgoS-Bajun TaxID=2948594 RepID=A0A9E7N6Z5_9CAUD|nr:hypothetical protein BAJUN_01020 [Brevundimonas phage vB_BgoS-Bajun]